MILHHPTRAHEKRGKPRASGDDPRDDVFEPAEDGLRRELEDVLTETTIGH